MKSYKFNSSEAKKWLELRRHLVMLDAANNEPTYLTDNKFQSKRSKHYYIIK